jgi:hypothetical protein
MLLVTDLCRQDVSVNRHGARAMRLHGDSV